MFEICNFIQNCYAQRMIRRGSYWASRWNSFEDLEEFCNCKELLQMASMILWLWYVTSQRHTRKKAWTNMSSFQWRMHLGSHIKEMLSIDTWSMTLINKHKEVLKYHWNNPWLYGGGRFGWKQERIVTIWKYYETKLCGNKDTIMTQGFADWRACNLG